MLLNIFPVAKFKPELKRLIDILRILFLISLDPNFLCQWIILGFIRTFVLDLFNIHGEMPGFF